MTKQFCMLLSIAGLVLLAFDARLWGNPTSDQDFKPIFDGQSLNGWQGDEHLWRVEDGVIIGETTLEKPIASNRFLAWTQGEVDDFVFRCQYRVSGSPQANSGVQFRSQRLDDGRMKGYQADIDASGTYTGILYSEGTGRGILCPRGEQVTFLPDNEKSAQRVADANAFLKEFDLNGWNQMEVEARGTHLIVKINGQVTAEVFDNDPVLAVHQGFIGFQLHQGPPMKIEFKDISLKRLPLSDGRKKIVFVAGTASHGRGSHEHNAGCLLLADRLDKSSAAGEVPVVTTVYQNGWPQDPTAFDNADTVVSFCDGGRGHYLHQHGAEFAPVMERGVGLALLHYGVEVPPGESGDRFLNWAGGYFEIHWSVNPFWTAQFESLPDHPITRGVQPFEMHDEWYYHMRFVPEMRGVTPLLSALPPAESLSRPDGPHSGNPDVRRAVLEDKQPQHLAWAYDRAEGKGRGFGYTGGHFHNGWKQDDNRKLVLNAIVWTAGLEVPAEGITSATPTDQELEENLDQSP
jgi:type 1 glutamine amidotransferase